MSFVKPIVEVVRTPENRSVSGSCSILMNLSENACTGNYDGEGLPYTFFSDSTIGCEVDPSDMGMEYCVTNGGDGTALFIS